MYECMFVSMFVCMYVCMYVCVCPNWLLQNQQYLNTFIQLMGYANLSDHISTPDANWLIILVGIIYIQTDCTIRGESTACSVPTNTHYWNTNSVY